MRGAVAAAFAVSIPGPVYRKYGECGRSTRTRRSATLRPWSGRRPPIMGCVSPRYGSLDRRQARPSRPRLAGRGAGAERRRRRCARGRRAPTEAVSKLVIQHAVPPVIGDGSPGRRPPTRARSPRSTRARSPRSTRTRRSPTFRPRSGRPPRSPTGRPPVDPPASGAGPRPGCPPGLPRSGRRHVARSASTRPCRGPPRSRADRRRVAARRCPGWRGCVGRPAPATSRPWARTCASGRHRGDRRSGRGCARRGGGRSQTRQGSPSPRRRRDVLPRRVTRAAVDQGQPVHLATFRERGEPGAGRRGDPPRRPFDRAPGVRVEPLGGGEVEGGPIVVAAHPDRVDAPQAGHDLVRMRPVPDHVAEVPDRVDPAERTEHVPRARAGWRGCQRGPRSASGRVPAGAARRRSIRLPGSVRGLAPASRGLAPASRGLAPASATGHPVGGGHPARPVVTRGVERARPAAAASRPRFGPSCGRPPGRGPPGPGGDLLHLERPAAQRHQGRRRAQPLVVDPRPLPRDEQAPVSSSGNASSTSSGRAATARAVTAGQRSRWRGSAASDSARGRRPRPGRPGRAPRLPSPGSAPSWRWSPRAAHARRASDRERQARVAAARPEVEECPGFWRRSTDTAARESRTWDVTARERPGSRSG